MISWRWPILFLIFCNFVEVNFCRLMQSCHEGWCKEIFLLILSYSVECRWPLNQVTRWLACHIRLDLVRRLFMFPQIACVGKLHSFSSSSFGEVHVGSCIPTSLCKGYSLCLTKSLANCHNFILFFKPRNFIRTAARYN